MSELRAQNVIENEDNTTSNGEDCKTSATETSGKIFVVRRTSEKTQTDRAGGEVETERDWEKEGEDGEETRPGQEETTGAETSGVHWDGEAGGEGVCQTGEQRRNSLLVMTYTGTKRSSEHHSFPLLKQLQTNK